MTMARRLSRFGLLGVLSALSGSMILGCQYSPESTAQLASDSRLPKWVRLPQGLSRGDVSMTMDYYVKPWGSSAKFVVEDGKKQIVQTIDGGSKCKEDFHMEGSSGYPAYQAITFRGVTEIFERKDAGTVVSVSDDAAVLKHYLGIGCD